jgi:tetratricopeptide (TPR) repeat protein
MSIDKADWSTSDKLIQQAQALFEIDRPREALPLLTQALSLTPENAQVLGWMTCCFIHLGDKQRAFQYAEATIKADPLDEWGYRLCSIILRQMGKNKKALAAAQRAVELAPEDGYTLLEYSNALASNKKYQEALGVAEKLRGLWPEKSAAHALLGHIFFLQKRWSDAEQHLRTAIRLDPNSYLALNNLGLVLIEQSVRKFWRAKDARTLREEGLAFLERAVKLSPHEELARANVRHSIMRIEALNPVFILLLIPVCFCFVWWRFSLSLFSVFSNFFFLALISAFSIWRKNQYPHPIRAIYEHEQKRSVKPTINSSLSSSAVSLGIGFGLIFLVGLLASSISWALKILLAFLFVALCLLASKQVR